MSSSDSSDSSLLSTSALARKLGKSSRQMFAELEALGWILREDERWVLTEKGKYEGGEYLHSKRFGTYVAWPADKANHRALVNEDSQLLNATALAKKLGVASASFVNRILHELGWIEPGLKGWVVTDAGRRAGGRQAEHARTGTPFGLWSLSVEEHPALRAVLDCLSATADREGLYLCLDGRKVKSDAQRRVANWLYLSGVAFATERRLPLSEEGYAELYVPAARLWIRCVPENETAGSLGSAIERKEQCRTLGITLIELDSTDQDTLDSALAKQLLKLGVEAL